MEQAGLHTFLTARQGDKGGVGMKALITGGAGFIGSFVVQLLQDHGHETVVVDNLIKGRRENLPGRTKLHQMDISDPDLVWLLQAEKPEVVLHLAAQVSVKDSISNPVYDASTNLLGSLNLLQAAVLAGCRKLVYTSSAAVYGNPCVLPVEETHPIEPCSPYGISKHSVEHYLPIYRRLHGLDYTVLRLANVYGPRQEFSAESGVSTIFVQRSLQNQPLVIYGDGEQTRDFVYVEDVALGCLLALDKGSEATVNIGTGIETTINGLLSELKQIISFNPRRQYAPDRPGDIRRSALSNQRASEILGWTPRHKLLDGLDRTVSWARQLKR
jgi:UDP-glucose 4-epimerase